MPRLTELLAYGQGGLTVTLLAALLVLSRRVLPDPPRWAIHAAVACAALSVLAEVVLSTWYLFSPTYIDHIEASVASITQYFLQGIPVYPDPGSYTFHGLLYGPLLPELNSLGYRVGGGVLGSKLVGWAAAWLAIILIALTTPRTERNWAWAASLVGSYCVLASFGSILTADRADSLLLLFATVALWAVIRLRPVPGLVLAALLAGLAADLKLHGPAYIVPALGLWAARHLDPRPRARLATAFVAAGAGAAGLIIPFIPANISAADYLGYIRLGARHGLSLELFAWNSVFLVSLWIPALLVLLALRKERTPAPQYVVPFAALLLTAEIAVIVVASKPGAGAHHLLPFLGFHSFLLQRMLVAAAGRQRDAVSWRELPAARAALTGLAAVLVGTAYPAVAKLNGLLKFDLQGSSQRAQLEELTRFADRYPHGMVGLAGRESYALTLFRPWITLKGTLQTDYGAWMDWNLSGASDAPLARALWACEIPYLYVPAGGEPFTMDSGYGTGPLFSDAVRESFTHGYSLVHPGQYFDVYGCAVAPTGSITRASQ
jgi:hypothetical protein